jgi:hypothetical protein
MTRKLKLDVETLGVESFRVDAKGSEAKGTVLGNQAGFAAYTLDRLCHTHWSCPVTY